AMKNAANNIKGEGISIIILPTEKTMEENTIPFKGFKYGSLSRKPYLQEFLDILCEIKGCQKRKIETCEESIHDYDWYVV
ncbi:MAG: hypothetical protein QW728_01645, partial [Thermoplasmata archaeon]